MKINVLIQVDIDADKWAEYNGIARNEVRADVRQYLLNHIQSAALVEGCDGKTTLKN